MGCDVGRERKRRMKDNPKVFGLDNEKNRVSRKGDGEAIGSIA